MKKLRLISLLAALCLLCSCSLAENIKDLLPSANTEKPIDLTTETADTGMTVTNLSSGEILDYFNEVAFGSEYGKSAGVICKWTKKISYAVTGSATEEDLALIESLCDTLNEIEGFPGIKKISDADKADLVVSFVPGDELVEMFDAAATHCSGMAEYRWNSSTGEIISARAAIDEAAAEERFNTICEEFLQALGPARDSYSQITSVFYEGTNYAPAPAEIDWAIMEILYSPEITPGMSRREAIAAASAMLRWSIVE